MKNICTFLLAVIILLSLTACGSSASTTSPAASDNADNTATVESGEASAEENQSEQQTSSGAVQVDEGLLNVTITLPIMVGMAVSKSTSPIMQIGASMETNLYSRTNLSSFLI